MCLFIIHKRKEKEDIKSRKIKKKIKNQINIRVQSILQHASAQLS